ncbi:Threonine/homoserine efflux transporter RhtA [Fodinibius salinus]|uniref:Threonine/homoserine efflux transporter RhtA n=1 Tax=Fodinibius salinus TaxID=860790 RepID=A0A5D3YMN2_9BACT|nr:DMT family transporter [Fodinibius salinus]TYP93399.1 Threonine/homoserine efflux transporter RhtA [Fodinibius salinus]
MSSDYPKIQVLAALAAGLASFGFAPILVRFVPETSPFVLVVYRTVFAALMLLPFWLWTRNNDQRAGKSKERMWMALSGACLGLHFTCWIASIYYTSVASASVLVTIHPIIMILVERFWFKKSFATATWIGVVLAFAGSVLLGISDSQIEQSFADPLFGNFLAFSAALIFVIYLLIGQQIRQKRAWIDYVFPVYFYAAVTCILIAVVLGKDLTNISTVGIWAGAGLAFGPQILGHGSMNYAVKYISPTLLSTLILVEPLLASVLAFIIFSEMPPIVSILAMVIILFGVALTWKRSTEKSGKKSRE